MTYVPGVAQVLTCVLLFQQPHSCAPRLHSCRSPAGFR